MDHANMSLLRVENVFFYGQKMAHTRSRPKYRALGDRNTYRLQNRWRKSRAECKAAPGALHSTIEMGGFRPSSSCMQDLLLWADYLSPRFGLWPKGTE